MPNSLEIFGIHDAFNEFVIIISNAHGRRVCVHLKCKSKLRTCRPGGMVRAALVFIVSNSSFAKTRCAMPFRNFDSQLCCNRFVGHMHFSAAKHTIATLRVLIATQLCFDIERDADSGFVAHVQISAVRQPRREQQQGTWNRIDGCNASLA